MAVLSNVNVRIISVSNINWTNVIFLFFFYPRRTEENLVQLSVAVSYLTLICITAVCFCNQKNKILKLFNLPKYLSIFLLSINIYLDWVSSFLLLSECLLSVSVLFSTFPFFSIFYTTFHNVFCGVSVNMAYQIHVKLVWTYENKDLQMRK